MAWSGGRRQRVEEIVEAIRADIVLGKRRTGAEVVVAELSEGLDAALSDVRQALLLLADQHLVAESADGAFHVVKASTRDLRDVTALRQLLEGDAVRLSVTARATGWVDRLQTAFRELEAAGAAAENPGLDMTWRLAHTEFHEALCAGCGNERLLAAVGSLRDEAEIYRELSAAAMTADRRLRVDAEHRDLLALALAGDADGAAATLRTHLEGTMRSVVDDVLDGENR